MPPRVGTALDQVARLPLCDVPPVTVCSAFDVAMSLSSGVAPRMASQIRPAYRDSVRWAQGAAEVMADGATRRLRDRGITAVGRTSRGPAHEELATFVREMSVDLLVVGSRGLSAIERFMLGSTSAALVGRPPTNVLVARRPTD